MKQVGLGVILAALAIFIWGFLYWAAGQALLEHFPESGTYYLPGLYNDEETFVKLHEAGPVAFIHMTARS